jgi:guanylate kinase
MQPQRLFIFSAPSGAGKTTIARHLLESYPERMTFSISATTRAKRAGEEHGRDYYFLSREEFQAAVARGEFAEHEEFFGNYYGTFKAEVQRALDAGQFVVFDVDVKGALSLQRAYPNDALLIFVAPPSMDELRRRLSARKTETAEQLELRFARAVMEMSEMGKFDVVIMNNDLDLALSFARTLAEEHFAQAADGIASVQSAATL